MKTLFRSLPLVLGAACLVAGSAALGDARTAAYNDDGDSNVHIRVLRHGDTDVRMRDGEVVITARDGSEARVTQAGDLYIRDQAVTVSADQRKLLRRYNTGIRNIEARGMQIGRDALHMVGGIMGVVVANLFSGDIGDDNKIEADARSVAAPLKQEARGLCQDVQTERQVQAAIAAGLPAFQPYAVIYAESDHDCHVDDGDIQV
jgi:hypothetical protein